MDGDLLDSLIITSGKCLPDASDRYVYPIVPGMQEWNNASFEGRNRLSQLPDKKVKSLSTFALIQSLLEKPQLSLDFMVSSHSSPVVTCYNRIYSSHNSVPELEKRSNTYEALIAYYESICWDCSITAGFDVLPFQLTVLEILFTREQILQPMDVDQKKHVVALLLENYKQESEIRGRGRVASVTVMAWIMLDDNYSPFKTFHENNEMSKYEVYGNQMDDVILFAKNYISKDEK
jgi:hypothetical protein